MIVSAIAFTASLFNSLVAKLFAKKTSPSTVCPDGWEEYEDSCYRAMEGKMNWEEAEAVCNLEEVSLSLSNDELQPNPLTAGTLGLHQRPG